MEKDQQVDENLIQDEAAGELDEKEKWKERLREEIMKEEKERILTFVESEVTKKMGEIERLLEMGGKPAILVVIPIDLANMPILRLPLEQGSNLCDRLTNTGNRKSSPPLIQDSDIKGNSDLQLISAKDDSAENPMIPLEEAKAEV
jgi:hypothetical protein